MPEDIQKVLHEAARRSVDDVQVHAEIETTRQILVRMKEFGWADDDDHQALICTAAAIAITLHDPMDGTPLI